MKRLNLNPTGRTVYKISQPGMEAARQKFTIEPMRFVPHTGVARATFVLVSSATSKEHKVVDGR